MRIIVYIEVLHNSEGCVSLLTLCEQATVRSTRRSFIES
jgi:hypothetical protein